MKSESLLIFVPLQIPSGCSGSPEHGIRGVHSIAHTGRKRPFTYRSLVQHQDVGGCEQGACERYELPLPLAEIGACIARRSATRLACNQAAAMGVKVGRAVTADGLARNRLAREAGATHAEGLGAVDRCNTRTRISEWVRTAFVYTGLKLTVHLRNVIFQPRMTCMENVSFKEPHSYPSRRQAATCRKGQYHTKHAPQLSVVMNMPWVEIIPDRALEKSCVLWYDREPLTHVKKANSRRI